MASTTNDTMATLPAPILTLTHCYLRPYHPSDAPSVAKEANNPLISRYMRNLFPSPYTLADAETWISIANKRKPPYNFAIFKLDGTYVGGIGLKEIGDVEYRTMEIGYWLGEAHWGLGIATDATVGFSRWAFDNGRCLGHLRGLDYSTKVPDLLRLEAGVYSPNCGSQRVLEKAGYTLEGRRRRAGCKNGVVFDILMFSMLRDECKGLSENGNAA